MLNVSHIHTIKTLTLRPSLGRVHRLHLRMPGMEHLVLNPAYFFNILELGISHPIHDKIWSVISILDHWSSLRLSTYGQKSESDLQVLFDSTSRFHRLLINDPHSSQFAVLFRLKNKSIRQLQFYVITVLIRIILAMESVLYLPNHH